MRVATISTYLIMKLIVPWVHRKILMSTPCTCTRGQGRQVGTYFGRNWSVCLGSSDNVMDVLGVELPLVLPPHWCLCCIQHLAGASTLNCELSDLSCQPCRFFRWNFTRNFSWITWNFVWNVRSGSRRSNYIRLTWFNHCMSWNNSIAS